MSPSAGMREEEIQPKSQSHVGKTRTRRAEGQGGDAGDVLDKLARPAELSNDLLVGERRQGRVRPGVAAKLVAEDVLLAEDVGLAKCARANDVEGRLEVVVAEVVEQDGGVERRSVVEGETPGVFLRALDDVGLVGALAARPPAVATKAEACVSVGVLRWVGVRSRPQRT